MAEIAFQGRSPSPTRDCWLTCVVEHDTRIDEKELERLFQRGAKAWRDVPDAAE